MTRPTNEQIKALRKGDVVTVRAVVTDVYNENVFRGDSSGGPFWFGHEDIAYIEPRTIQVGDRVRINFVNTGLSGTVRLVEGQQAAILWDSMALGACRLSDLELIP